MSDLTAPNTLTELSEAAGYVVIIRTYKPYDSEKFTLTYSTFDCNIADPEINSYEYWDAFDEPDVFKALRMCVK